MGKRLSAAHKKAISAGLRKHHSKKSTKKRTVPSAKRLMAAKHKADDAFMRTTMSPEAYKAYVARKRLLKRKK